MNVTYSDFLSNQAIGGKGGRGASGGNGTGGAIFAGIGKGGGVFSAFPTFPGGISIDAVDLIFGNEADESPDRFGC